MLALGALRGLGLGMRLHIVKPQTCHARLQPLEDTGRVVPG